MSEKKGKKKSTPKPFQDEKWLRENYGEGKMTAGEIARAHKVSRAAVLHYLKKFKIPITTRRSLKAGAQTDFRKDSWLKKKIEEGLSVYKIAKMQGTTYTTISNRVHKLGLDSANKPTPKKPAVKKTTAKAAKK
jgi:hypothetical protein